MRIADLIEAVERDGAAAVVIVAEVRGSAPREAGAAMLVTATASLGTIGGGTVEHRAIERARALLVANPQPGLPPRGEAMRGGAAGDSKATASLLLDFPLGPALDQCCGGHMRVGFATFGAGDLPRLRAAGGALALWPGGPVLRNPVPDRTVLVYGAGHVGAALVRALAPLPFQIRWIDARLDAFPADRPEGIETVATPLPEAEATAAPADALHVVLTHSHALDLEIVAAVLDRGQFGFLGLIGSATKKALFLRRLRARGVPEGRLARLACPIGLPGLNDKRPAVIAAGVAAQLLQVAAAGAAQTSRESA